DLSTRHADQTTCIAIFTTYSIPSFSFFFLTAPPATEIYTLSLHDALPIFRVLQPRARARGDRPRRRRVVPHRRIRRRDESGSTRSEEHTSELQSPYDLVCRLLLEKKKHKLDIQRGRCDRRHANDHLYADNR